MDDSIRDLTRFRAEKGQKRFSRGTADRNGYCHSIDFAQDWVGIQQMVLQATNKLQGIRK